MSSEPVGSELILSASFRFPELSRNKDDSPGLCARCWRRLQSPCAFRYYLKAVPVSHS